jgi:uncharacterized protein YkwD
VTPSFRIKSLSVCAVLALVLGTGSARFAAAETPATDAEGVLGPAVSLDMAEPPRPGTDELGPDSLAPDLLAPDTLAPTYIGCSTVVPTPVNAAWEQEVIELVNQQRLSNGGLPPLKRVTGLDSASRNHGVDMLLDNYFQHDSYDRDGSGNLVLSCGWSTRVAGFYSGWSTLGENIAAGQSSPSAVVTAWMGSPGHRANILSTNSWEMGAGYHCCGGTYNRYWVQDFGRRSNVFPLVIEREKASTTSQSVAIYLYGSFAEMRLRSDSNAFGAWQPFSNSFNWTLPAGSGTHTVYAEMRSGSTVRSAEDSIQLVFGGTPMPTATSPAQPTPTQLPLPTPTQGGGGGQTLTFGAPHDALVASNYPYYNFGNYTSLLARGGSPTYRSFLKFTVAGLTRPVQNAKLRLYVSDGSNSGGQLYGASNNYYNSGSPWSESGVTWYNMPGLFGNQLASLGPVSTGSWVELNVTSAVSGNGTYSFGLVTSSSDQVGYRSGENSSGRPELVIQTIP